MRPEPNIQLDAWRLREPRSERGKNWGAFAFKRHGKTLRVISSGTDEEHGWEHVSVSLAGRTPTWQEMCYVKSLFWDDDELVLQFHPPKSDYINQHEYCLHLWRPLHQQVELPPVECV